MTTIFKKGDKVKFGGVVGVVTQDIHSGFLTAILFRVRGFAGTGASFHAAFEADDGGLELLAGWLSRMPMDPPEPGVG